MTNQPKILAIGGSLRKGSYNKMLAKIAAEGARKAGASVTYVDLADYPLPPYNADDEETKGLPENAKKLKKLFVESDGFLFSSPEYNSSISGVFKNVIDWVSRPEDSDPYYLVAFKGKTAAIMSASPGALGGLRGLVHVRAILNNVGTLVIPDQFTVCKADSAFNEDGQLTDPKSQEKVFAISEKLTVTTRKMTNP